jgi:hypothetical protein
VDKASLSFERAYDSGTFTSPLAQSRHRRQQELWARTAAVAGG